MYLIIYFGNGMAELQERMRLALKPNVGEVGVTTSIFQFNDFFILRKFQSINSHFIGLTPRTGELYKKNQYFFHSYIQIRKIS